MDVFLITMAMILSGIFMGQQFCVLVNRNIKTQKMVKIVLISFIAGSILMIVLLLVYFYMILLSSISYYHYFFFGMLMYPINYNKVFKENNKKIYWIF